MTDRPDDAVSWPSHIGKIHPHLAAHHKAVATEELLPFQIDYALAVIMNLPPVELNYMPDLKWATVRFREDKAVWNPTGNMEQAKRAQLALPAMNLPAMEEELPAVFRSALLELDRDGFFIPYPQSVAA